jgi:hypothetical protein
MWSTHLDYPFSGGVTIGDGQPGWAGEAGAGRCGPVPRRFGRRVRTLYDSESKVSSSQLRIRPNARRCAPLWQCAPAPSSALNRSSVFGQVRWL